MLKSSDHTSETKPSLHQMHKTVFALNAVPLHIITIYVCTSFLNPRPDAAAFISPSDLGAFETSNSTPARPQTFKQLKSRWTYPHILTLFIIPPLHEPRGRFTGAVWRTLPGRGTLNPLKSGTWTEVWVLTSKVIQRTRGSETDPYHNGEEGRWASVAQQHYAVKTVHKLVFFF